MKVSSFLMGACSVLLASGLASAADSGFGIVAEGTPYSTIPSSVLSEVNKYQITYKTYQGAVGVIYGNPLGGHFVMEGVGYTIDATAKQSEYSATSKDLRVFGARGGGHIKLFKRDMFGIGIDLLGGVGQLSGNFLVERTGSGSTISTTVSAQDKWKQATGLSILPLIHIGPTVTFPIANKTLCLTVGAAVDVPGGIVMTTGIIFSPGSWRH